MKNPHVFFTKFPLNIFTKEASDQRQTPEETVWSFSEALRILDKNEAKYMIEVLTAELEQERAKAEKADAERNELQKQLAALQEQLNELQNRNSI